MKIEEVHDAVSLVLKDTKAILGRLDDFSPKNGEVEIVKVRRGDLTPAYYAPIYRKADRIHMVGVALNDFIRGGLYCAQGNNKLTSLDANNVLSIMNQRAREGRKGLSISAIMADPTSEFSKNRHSEDEKTIHDILDNLNLLYMIHEHVEQTKGDGLEVAGSISVYLSNAELTKSVFNTRPGTKAYGTALYGIILDKLPGFKCPMIAAHDLNGNRSNELQRELENYAEFLESRAGNPVFRWEGKKTTWSGSKIKNELQGRLSETLIKVGNGDFSNVNKDDPAMKEQTC